MELADRVDVFYGSLSPAEGPVYARIDQLPGGASWTLSGEVRGPRCEWARTLPATYSFRDLGPGPTLLAQAVVTDPCFWSPAMPALYEVTLELRQAGTVVERIERRVGFRNLGADRQNLIWDGKRWVLRGVIAESALAQPLEAWRAAAAAQIIDHPSCDVCREADEKGVLVAARIDGSRSHRHAETRRLARFASVGFLIDLGKEPLENERGAPNVLHSQWFPAGTESKPASWAQVAFCEVDAMNRLVGQAEFATLPVVAVRRSTRAAALTEARAACDLLQRHLASYGNLAGYVV